MPGLRKCAYNSNTQDKSLLEGIQDEWQVLVSERELISKVKAESDWEDT